MLVSTSESYDVNKSIVFLDANLDVYVSPGRLEMLFTKILCIVNTTILHDLLLYDVAEHDFLSQVSYIV